MFSQWINRGLADKQSWPDALNQPDGHTWNTNPASIIHVATKIRSNETLTRERRLPILRSKQGIANI